MAHPCGRLAGVLLGLLLCTTALSLPINLIHAIPATQSPIVTCDSVDTYTTEWFLQNTLPDFRQEIHEKALFYTRGMSEKARRLACNSKDIVSLWDVWPSMLYDDSNAPENRMRCIHQDHEMRQTFYENMSRAYARMARKTAVIMHSAGDYTNPPQDGIWGRIELLALRTQTDVLEMKKIDEDHSQSVRWPIPDKAAQAVYEQAILEVQALFRGAKHALDRVSGAAAKNSCSLWNSKDDAFLESLW